MSKEPRIISLDWQAATSPMILSSLDSDTAIHENDIAFFDPLSFINNFSGKCGMHEDKEIHTTFARENLSFVLLMSLLNRKNIEMNSFLENGILICRLNFPKLIWTFEYEETIWGNKTKNFKLEDWFESYIGKLRFNYHKGSTLKIVDKDFLHPIVLEEATTSYKQSLKLLKTNTFKTVATNRLEEPILYYSNIKGKNGKIIFVPFFNTPNENQELVNWVKYYWENKHVKDNYYEPPPSWINNFNRKINEFSIIEQEINTIEKIIETKETEKDKLTSDKFQITKFSNILFSKGKIQLEKNVLKSLSLVGFNVPKKEKFKDKYDFHIELSERIIAVGEITGTDNSPIPTKKFAQLLKWSNSHLLDEEKKGILIGNAYRELPPATRKEAFPPDLIERNKKQQFCLLTTYELYKIVCFILNNNPSDEIKKEIQDSILSCNDVYEFKEKELLAKVNPCTQ